MIENNILAISNAMFKNKNDWGKVTEEQKKQFFFIFNRYFSKKYLDLAQSLNHKETDNSVAMDLWYEFMKNKPYPQWFWSKSPKSDSKEEISDKDISELQKKLEWPRNLESRKNYGLRKRLNKRK